MLSFFVFVLLGLSAAECSESSYHYAEKYFNQRVDHFNLISHGNQTFKQRYLYNDENWDRGSGPIFFYAGNEGDIEGFWNNTGFIFKAAERFRALVLFAEHRFYGKSLPFGEASFNRENIGLLSIEQALADYAFFIKSFKETFGAQNCPVIAFGGSYGGILAAYMRFKFPNIIEGSIAASAPIFLIARDSEDQFFEAVTKDFRNVSPLCERQVRSAFSQLQKWAKMGSKGYQEISQTFRLCSGLQSADDFRHLLLWVRNAFVMGAMMDYPYPADFMGHFPAYPVKAMCELLQSAARPADGLRAAAALFYNASGSASCFNIYEEYIECSDPTGCGLGSDSTAWNYQACTEVNMEYSTTGVRDMFPPLPFNSLMRDEYCLKTFNVLPRRDILDVVFWGKDIASSSNIVFSNGELDPWVPGGVLRNVSDSIVSIMVEGGAHHLDLRADNPADPISVREVREFELRHIQKWLREFYSKNNFY